MADNDDIFAELNAEIEKALAKSKLPKQVADAKKLAFDRTVGEAVRQKRLAEYKALQALLDLETWEAVSTYALFSEQSCDGCGSIHRMFLQYMELQEQKNKRSNRRWVRTSLPYTQLPRKVFIQYNRTHICADCCEDSGFDYSQAERLDITNAPLAISPNYLQGDIHAEHQEDRPTTEA